MSWTEIEPFLRAYAKRGAAVEFAITKQLGSGKDRPPIIQITIRRALIPDCPELLQLGQSVRVLVGDGENAGTVRIVPGGKFLMAACGGKRCARSRDISLLRFPLPVGVLNTLGRSECEFDYGEDWLEIDVPKWARAAAPPAPIPPSAPQPPAAPQPAVTAARPKQAPFKSAIADVAHNPRKGT